MSASGLLGMSDRRWHKLSRGKLIRRALYVILLIGVPDYLLGGRTSLALLYVVPIGVVAWYVGRRWAWLLALISLTPTLLTGVQTGRLPQQPVLLIWQGVQHLGFLWLIIWLLDGRAASRPAPPRWYASMNPPASSTGPHFWSSCNIGSTSRHARAAHHPDFHRLKRSASCQTLAPQGRQVPGLGADRPGAEDLDPAHRPDRTHRR